MFVDSDTDSALSYSIDLAETVESITGVPVTVWASPYSLDGNSIVWTSRFESVREMDDAQANLLSAEMYRESLRQMPASFTDPHLETLAEVFLGPLPAEPAPFLTTLRAQARTGRRRQAIDWALRLRDNLAHGLGVPVTFNVTVFGEVGGLTWLAYHRDADSLQTANSKMLVDENTSVLFDEGEQLLQPGLTLLMMRRLN